MTAAGALVVQQVNDQPGGFRATVSLISHFNGINAWPDGTGSNTVRVTACDSFFREDGSAGAQLYVATGTPSTRRLYVTNDAGKDYGPGPDPNVAAGTTWQEISSPGLTIPGTNQIGCDGRKLYAFNSQSNLYVAGVNKPGFVDLRWPHGTFDTWAQVGINSLFNDLQSGAGNLYVIGRGATNSLYTQDFNTPGTWKTLSNLPADFVRVTGAGKANLATLTSTPGNRISGWSPANRAFAIKSDGTLAYNDKVLSNPAGNTWVNLNFDNATGPATFEDISASAPDVLWAITNTGGMRHLHEIRFTELSCSDGLDNDADGLTDGRDPDCILPLATSYCSAGLNRIRCSSRFTNSADFLVFCFNQALSSLTRGRCVQSAPSPFPHAQLPDTMISTNIPEPSGTGRWCSAIYRPSDAWSVKTSVSPGVTGDDPCAFIEANKPAGQTVEITGAGLYSRTGVNNVIGACDDNSAAWIDPNRINGTAPIDDVVQYLAGAHACKFLISPTSLPIFDLPYDPVAVSQLGATVTYGSKPFDPNPGNHGAWDIVMPEGVPVLAVAQGTVVGVATDPATGIAYSGSQDWDQTADADDVDVGDSRQPEISIVHNVQSGLSDRYRESFVSRYVHLRQRIVAAGQVVQRGQIIGYVGTQGYSSEPHIHFEVVRLSNTALSVTDADPSTVVAYAPRPLGLTAHGKSMISPFGWRGTGQDPWGAFNGLTQGAFSAVLWSSPAQTPPAPPIQGGW